MRAVLKALPCWTVGTFALNYKMAPKGMRGFGRESKLLWRRPQRQRLQLQTKWLLLLDRRMQQGMGTFTLPLPLLLLLRVLLLRLLLRSLR